MTPSLEKLIEDLRELEAKATPGPLTIRKIDGSVADDPDAVLHMESRNALPLLLNIIEIQRKALEEISKYSMVGCHTRFSFEADKAIEALAECDALCKGDG